MICRSQLIPLLLAAAAPFSSGFSPSSINRPLPTRKSASSAPTFVTSTYRRTNDATSLITSPWSLWVSTQTTAPTGFIDTELRGAAMKLHTRSQAPKEGEAKEEPKEPYIPTHDDYLRFLVDSQHVYKTFEEVIKSNDDLKSFRNTGLERTKPLESDIKFMVEEYELTRPPVGEYGLEYAKEIRRIVREGSIPQLMCHYYNFYFAHTAGGRMIGKRMSSLLLNGRTLEFYKWENLNKIKTQVKENIEQMVESW
eukprot:CAMPEP_0172497692 /NCGR_PEP_ID=MMETSP1066-20121228/103576_1 /TAXON_ID=671091 /ORGANISM="Coscinodiscus wailesii, Strain CCMP2513" /LENGTH=252 /DNA_ID=CAMNT_0013270605 /DNA_START=45 /DNA_END=800 /DNA_ORIENTATION=+